MTKKATGGGGLEKAQLLGVFITTLVTQVRRTRPLALVGGPGILARGPFKLEITTGHVVN